jgi:hypothetical protein
MSHPPIRGQRRQRRDHSQGQTLLRQDSPRRLAGHCGCCGRGIKQNAWYVSIAYGGRNYLCEICAARERVAMLFIERGYSSPHPSLDKYLLRWSETLARVDIDREDRDNIAPLTLSQTRDCEGCDLDLQVIYTAPAGVEDMEDIEEADALTATVKCPECNFVNNFTYDGWTVHGDAG